MLASMSRPLPWVAPQRASAGSGRSSFFGQVVDAAQRIDVSCPTSPSKAARLAVSQQIRPVAGMIEDDRAYRLGQNMASGTS